MCLLRIIAQENNQAHLQVLCWWSNISESSEGYKFEGRVGIFNRLIEHFEEIDFHASTGNHCARKQSGTATGSLFVVK